MSTSPDTPPSLMGYKIKGGVPANGDLLAFNSATQLWEPFTLPPGTPHDLLDGLVDQDTVAAAVQAGDLIFGNATPLWDRLPKGAAGALLQIGGLNLPEWLAPGIDGYLLVMVGGVPAWMSFGASSGYLKGGDPPTLQTGIPLADLENAGGNVGDLIYWDGNNWVVIPIGSNGDYFVVAGGIPSWSGSPPVPTTCSQVIACSNKAPVGSSTGATVYTPPMGLHDTSATESPTQIVMPFDGDIKNAYVNVQTNAATNACTVTLRKNGADTALVITVTALTTGIFSDLTHSVSFVAGDKLDWKISQTTVGTALFTSISAQVDTAVS